MRRKKSVKMRGGGEGYMPGVEINGISSFVPLDIPGAVLWVKADPAKLVKSTITNYALNLSPTIAKNILQQYKSNPEEEVITEIQSDVPTQPNSLIRLELSTDMPIGFPKFVTKPGTLDVIDMSNLMDPVSNQKQTYKLTTKTPVKVDPDFSSWIISKNVTIAYVSIIDNIVLSTSYISEPSVPQVLPTAEFSEVIVFSRKVTEDEAKQMDGYIAYRKNEQYLLDINHPYLPAIESLPFMNAIATQIQTTEASLKGELSSFDSSVDNYKASLPTDPILDKAAPLKEKAAAALKQISELRKNFTKAALLSRKKGTETPDSVFQSMGELSLYSPPLTADIFAKKLADYSGVLQELQVYITSLGTVDEVVAKAKIHNNQSDQEQQLIAAQNVEELQYTQLQTQSSQVYMALRKRSTEIDVAGSAQYAAMISDLTKQIKVMADAFQYYAKDIESRWNSMVANFTTIDTQMSSGTWLTYVPSLDTSVISEVKRGNAAYSIQYTDSYLNKIQILYEQLRNQIKSGDFAYVKGEVLYYSVTMANFNTNLIAKKVNPVCKKTFLIYFKNMYKRVETYVKEFDSFYPVFTEAITTLSGILAWNRQNKQAAKLDKSFPISLVPAYLLTIKERYIREVNKHDASLTMIEYVITNADGTLLYGESEEKEVQLLFPSLENLHRHEQDMFFKRKTPFTDETGNPVYEKYTILEPYAKTASILDAIPLTQTLPRFFQIVSTLYEIPRSATNGICELSIESPQKPILLPKYALAPGSFFICANVGKLALQIQIPGFPEDMIDVLGPAEICMYNYTGPVTNTSTYYGRFWWSSNHLAYDMLRDTPRSTLCSKVTEFSKYIFMRTETDPLFDKDGFLVEAVPDATGTLYDIDDVYHSNPYMITVGTELHLSELVIHPEWSEQMLIRPKFDELYVIMEPATGLAVFCSSAGIPAIGEFGLCKYVMTPMLHIQDTIKTRGAYKDPIEIQLNPTATIVQYGAIPVILSFDSVFRSIFVKPMVTTGTVVNYIFINSAGYPFVAPTNTYIQVENPMPTPPYLVFYTDSVKQVHAYIPKHQEPPVPNATTLSVAPYSYNDITIDREQAIDKNTGAILSYRFSVNKSYIQSVLATVETKYDYCRTLPFAETRSTLALLQQSYTDIEKLQAEFLTYSESIGTIQLKQMSPTPDKQLKITIDTLDLKMKEIIEKVFASFTKATRAIEFFTKILDVVESIKKSVKHLRDVVFIENEKSILAVQGILRGDSNPDLSKLLSQMVTLKMDFESRLKTLEANIMSMPNVLANLDEWIQNQRLMIKKEYDVRRQITQIETTHTVDLYVKRMLNDSASTASEIQGVRTKADAYLAYKKAIALWLGVYPNQTEMYDYTLEIPKPVTGKPFKGYSISFPIFDELSNPSFSRDWESLVNTVELSDSLRSKITNDLIAPTKAFIGANTAFYTNADDTASIPTMDSLQGKQVDELKTILAASNTAMNALMGGAISNEVLLHPIFDKYESIRSDLRTELQAILQGHATHIQSLWITITGQSMAIQTNLQILQPYLTADQKVTADSILTSIDDVMTPDITQKVQGVQQSMKIPGFYTSISYMKMITLQGDYNILTTSLKSLQIKYDPIQAQLDSLQEAVLVNLQESVETARTNLKTSIQSAQVKLSASIGDNSALQTLLTTIQPKADALEGKDLKTIADCIGVVNVINDLNTQIQALLGSG